MTLRGAISGWVLGSLVVVCVPCAVGAQAAGAGAASLDFAPAVAVTAAAPDGKAVVSLRAASGAVVRVPVAGSRVDGVSTETVTVSKQGARLGIVHVKGDAHSLVLVAVRSGAPVAVYVGRENWVGDPGERSRVRVSTEDRTADGVADVVLFTERETVWVCGAGDAWAEAQAWDPKANKLRPVHVNRPPPAASYDTNATTARPADLEVDVPRTKDLAWDPAASARPANFISARWLGGANRMRALRWEQGPAGPTAFFVAFEGGVIAHVNVPATTAKTTLWVAFPGVTSPCFSILPDQRHGTPAVLSMAAVTAFSSVDFRNGVQGLLSAVIHNSGGANEAAQALAELPVGPGDAVVAPLVAAWPELTATAKQRVLRIFTQRAPADVAATNALTMVAKDRDLNLATAAVAALRAKAAPKDALPHYIALLGDALTQKDEARIALLLDATAACVKAAELGDSVRASYAGAPVATKARLAGALAKQSETRPLAQEFLREAFPVAKDFDDVFRLLRVAARTAADPAVDAWLEGVAAKGDPWMLRQAATLALVARQSPQGAAALASAVTDPAPRLREWAFIAGDVDPVMAAAAVTGDPWAFVRVAAVGALARMPAPLPASTADVLRRATTDAHAQVRAAAIAALSAHPEVPADTEVRARLASKDEDDVVLEASLAYAQARCATPLTPVLIQRLARARTGPRRDATADLAAALVYALGKLGGEDARRALQAIAKDSPSPAERDLATRALGEKSTCASPAAPR